MHPHTAHKHTNLFWIFVGLIFCALFLVFSLPKSMHSSIPTGANIAEFAPSVLLVSGLFPSTVYQGAALQIDIAGAEFNSSAIVSTSNPDVSVLSTVLVNDTLLQSNISVAINASEGTYNITVTQDNESSFLGALTIIEGPFDISTLTNVTPATGYIVFNTTLNLTYNVTTGFGVDKSSVNITGGFINITNLNTSNSTILNLTNVTDPSGTFTLQFEEHTFNEDGTYFGEIYLNVDVSGTEVDRELYTYFAVGTPCFAVSILGGSCCEPGAPVSGVLGFGGCDGTTNVCGQDFNCEPIFPPGSTPATLTCPVGAVTCSFSFFLQTGLFCELGGSGGSCPGSCFFDDSCTIPTYSCPPGSSMGALGEAGTKVCTAPPPSSGGGGGGGSNPYPAQSCCCIDGPLKGEVLTGPRCLNTPTNTKCKHSTTNLNDPACNAPVPTIVPPPKPKPVIEAPAPQLPVIEQKQVETHAQSPITMPSVGKAVEIPVMQESSSSSIALAVLAVLVIIGGLVYLQFFHKRRHR